MPIQDPHAINTRSGELASRVLTTIEAQYKEDISASSVAESIHISERHLRRIINEVFQRKFNDLLNNVRLTKSKELLINTSLTINQIIEETGYQSPYYFSNLFKKTEGISPTEFRKKYKKEVSD